ncbi:hypothetical protein WDZ92_46050, partial [Nostoc sp. NIES-2111]
SVSGSGVSSRTVGILQVAGETERAGARGARGPRERWIVRQRSGALQRWWSVRLRRQGVDDGTSIDGDARDHLLVEARTSTGAHQGPHL